MKKVFMCMVVLMISVGCKDATVARFAALGDSARITCHSGGVVIYDGCSTGAVSSQDSSDGWHFVDVQSQRLITVSGECLIDYGSPCPSTYVRPSSK